MGAVVLVMIPPTLFWLDHQEEVARGDLVTSDVVMKRHVPFQMLMTPVPNGRGGTHMQMMPRPERWELGTRCEWEDGSVTVRWDSTSRTAWDSYSVEIIE